MATDPRALGEQPAVPYSQVEESETYSRTYAQHRGLTKREFFAGMALMGFCSCERFSDNSYEEAADRSVRQADALLAALAGGVQ